MTEITRGTVWFRVGPPRRLAGLETRGYAVRFGVLLPPAAGPARAAALEAEGRRLLARLFPRRLTLIVPGRPTLAAHSLLPVVPSGRRPVGFWTSRQASSPCLRCRPHAWA